MTLAQLEAILAPFNPKRGPKRAFVALIEDVQTVGLKRVTVARLVIVWAGDGDMPAALRARFGTPAERKAIAER